VSSILETYPKGVPGVFLPDSRRLFSQGLPHLEKLISEPSDLGLAVFFRVRERAPGEVGVANSFRLEQCDPSLMFLDLSE
jgi:hypothetical protein